MRAINKFAHSIQKEKLRRDNRRRADANRRVNMRDARRIPARIKSIEISPAVRIGILQAAPESLALRCRAGSSRTVAERTDRRGINSLIVGVPDVNRSVCDRFAGVGVDDAET